MDILKGEGKDMFLNTDHKHIEIKSKTKLLLGRSVILLTVKSLPSFYFLQ